MAVGAALRLIKSRALIDAAGAACIAALLAIPLLGFHINESGRSIGLAYRLSWIAYVALAIFVARLGLFYSGLDGNFKRWTFAARSAPRLKAYASHRRLLVGSVNFLVVLFALGLPWFSFANETFVDRATLILIYIMLGAGLNIVVRRAGLLDLGYAAFYAIGAYAYALLSQRFSLSFWECLPISGLLAAGFGLAIASPVIRARSEYLAIATLAFGQMVQMLLANWTAITGGVKGIADIPRPGFFPLPSSATWMRDVYLVYYLVLAMVLLAGAFIWRINRLPLGRAWDALREDEIACRNLGLDPSAIKLSAFALAAGLAGFAGCVFAARQGSVSPADFTFIQTAMVLAIVMLGMRSQLGIGLTAIVLVGIPEWFPNLAAYRMIAVGVVLVLVMVWRLDGLSNGRPPTMRLMRRARPT